MPRSFQHRYNQIDLVPVDGAQVLVRDPSSTTIVPAGDPSVPFTSGRDLNRDGAINVVDGRLIVLIACRAGSCPLRGKVCHRAAGFKAARYGKLF